MIVTSEPQTETEMLQLIDHLCDVDDFLDLIIEAIERSPEDWTTLAKRWLDTDSSLPIEQCCKAIDGLSKCSVDQLTSNDTIAAILAFEGLLAP